MSEKLPQSNSAAELVAEDETASAEALQSLDPASEKRAEPAAQLAGMRRGMFGVHGSGDTTGFGGLEDPLYLPGESARPYGSWFDSVVDILEECLEAQEVPVREAISRVVVANDELTIHVQREYLPQVCRLLRDDQDLRFELCLGVSGVHYPAHAGAELHAVYHLFSITHNRLLRLEVTCPDADPQIPSVTAIYPGNDWHERETWDLMGIVFTGHPALTRTAMPDDWVGHPQRKDYPLGGIPVEYKGATVPPADIRRSYN